MFSLPRSGNWAVRPGRCAPGCRPDGRWTVKSIYALLSASEVSYERQKNRAAIGGTTVKARHIYEYLETIEAGISLTGPEVKSLRAGQVELHGQLWEFRRGEAWLIGLHIAPYTNAGHVEQNADRPRNC